VGQNQNN
jgi:hypothetical protein